MRSDLPCPPAELVQRSLGSGRPATIGQIHEWGQYHRSRMAEHVLAHLAHPGDPEALWDLPARADRIGDERLNVSATAALGSYLTLRAREEAEYAQALGVYELAYRAGRSRLSEEHHEWFVTAAYLGGRPERARELCAKLDVSDRLREAIACQELHPRRGGTTAAYLRRFKEFTNWPELADLADGEELGIESLRTAPVREVTDGPLISVIMTCYKPDRALLSAVRSIAAQSWQRWELLLVDDGSGPEYGELLREAVAIDPRVKLLIQPENAGTYQARNRAMAAAEGEFVTGLDSDDWAHPLRLEKQAQYLIANPRLVMVESRSLAVRDDLSLMIDPQVALVGSRSTLIMVRTEPIRDHIGFYDEVRKTADSEFRMRIKEHFGRRRWKRMTGGPLTLVRHTDTTLSSGEVGRHWMTTARLAFHSGFTYWHRRIAKGRSAAFLGALARPRPFPVCEDLLLPNAVLKATEYARVYAADWSRTDPVRTAMLDQAAAEAAAGRAIALAHCPDWEGVDGERALIHPDVLEAASAHGMHFLDDTRDLPVVVPSAAYRELYLFEHPATDPDLVGVQDLVEVPDAATSPIAVRVGSPPRLRGLVRRDDLAATVLGLGAVAATAVASWAVAPGALPWAALSAAAVWAGASGAFLTWQAVSRLRP